MRPQPIAGSLSHRVLAAEATGGMHDDDVPCVKATQGRSQSTHRRPHERRAIVKGGAIVKAAAASAWAQGRGGLCTRAPLFQLHPRSCRGPCTRLSGRAQACACGKSAGPPGRPRSAWRTPQVRARPMREPEQAGAAEGQSPGPVLPPQPHRRTPPPSGSPAAGGRCGASQRRGGGGGARRAGRRRRSPDAWHRAARRSRGQQRGRVGVRVACFFRAGAGGAGGGGQRRGLRQQLGAPPRAHRDGSNSLRACSCLPAARPTAAPSSTGRPCPRAGVGARLGGHRGAPQGGAERQRGSRGAAGAPRVCRCPGQAPAAPLAADLLHCAAVTRPPALKPPAQAKPAILPSFDLAGVAALIRAGAARRIICMVGAGISVLAQNIDSLEHAAHGNFTSCRCIKVCCRRHRRTSGGARAAGAHASGAPAQAAPLPLAPVALLAACSCGCKRGDSNKGLYRGAMQGGLRRGRAVGSRSQQEEDGSRALGAGGQQSGLPLAPGCAAAGAGAAHTPLVSAPPQ